VKNTKNILDGNGFAKFQRKVPKNSKKIYRINRGKNIAIARLGKKILAMASN